MMIAERCQDRMTAMAVVVCDNCDDCKHLPGWNDCDDCGSVR